MTSLNMSSKSSRSTLFGVKQSFLMLSTAEREGLTSSRYLGTPPVTERTSIISLGAILDALLPQNLMHSAGGSSPTTMSSDRLPTYALFSTISSLIQLETLPQSTSTRFECFLKRSSQAFLSISGKVSENCAIQDISSMRTTSRPLSPSSRSSLTNAEYQSDGGVLSHPVCAESFAAKNASWSRSVIPRLGRSPSSLINLAPERLANSSTSVDFPILRRPLHVTKEATRFPQRPSSSANSASRPKNDLSPLFMLRIITNRHSARQRKSSPILHLQFR